MIGSRTDIVAVGRPVASARMQGALWPRLGVRGSEALLVFGVIAAAAVAAAVMLYRNDPSSFLYFGDAVSHLTLSRLLVDSRTPGIDQIGTVWLPLPHLLYLPAALVDGFFFSGIAGPVIGIPLLAGLGALLFSILRMLDVPKWIGAFSALLFTLNPNMLYMALTPMTEVLLLFFVTLSAYLLLKWVHEARERFLPLAALAIACASLCRYEAWLCVPFLFVLAVRHARKKWYEGFYNRAFIALSSAALVTLGITFWLLWNYFRYHDALMFMHWVELLPAPDAAESVPMKIGRFETARLLGLALRLIYGPFVLIAAGWAVVRHIRRRFDEKTLLILVFLSLPGVFSLAAIMLGYAEVDQWRWNWRFMLMPGLFLVSTAALGFREMFAAFPSRAARLAVVLGALAIPVIQITMPSVGVSTYIDAKKGMAEETLSAEQAGMALKDADVPASAALVTGFGQAQRIMIAGGRPLKSYSYITKPGDDALAKPLWQDEAYVVLAKQTKPESQGLVRHWLARRDVLLAHYAIVHEDEYFLVLKLSPARTPYQAQDRARR
ncbi:MAG: ArnT family glycosyltransferase [Acidobacteriota bacterium]